jgi:hypothetical protein
MGTAAVAHQDVPKEFASKNEIAVAEQMYETDLGTLSPNLAGVKLKHYKDPNGFFIVSKEENGIYCESEKINKIMQAIFENNPDVEEVIISN